MKKNIYDIDNLYQNIGYNCSRLYSKILLDNFRSKTDKLETISAEIGISASFFQHIMNGQNSNQRPSLPTLVAICNYFEIEMNELLKNQ